MKTNVEKLEKSMIELEVEVEEEKVQAAFDKAFRNLAKKVNIPGFRKGKAPRKVIETYYGKEAVYEDVARDLIDLTYHQALVEADVDAVDRPEIDVVEIDENKSFIYKATVAVIPEVKLGNYKDVKVEKEEVNVTDEEVAAQLESMQKARGELKAVEDSAVQDGDYAYIDFTGYMDGEAFEGGSGNNYQLVIGSHTFIEGFEEQIIGMNAGEEKDIVVTFPEDYQAEEYAGKEATFHVKLNEIKRKELAPLDDDFAKEVGEFETLDELKADFKQKLQEHKEEKAKKDQRDEFAKQVVDQVEIEVPDAMVNARVEEMMDGFNQQLQRQGTTLEDYIKYTNSSMDEMKENFRQSAMQSVKYDLVFTAIAKEEKIEVDEERIEAEIEKLAKMYQKDKEEVRLMLSQTGGITFVVQDLLIEKTLDTLLENNNNDKDNNKQEQPQT